MIRKGRKLKKYKVFFQIKLITHASIIKITLTIRHGIITFIKPDKITHGNPNTTPKHNSNKRQMPATKI